MAAAVVSVEVLGAAEQEESETAASSGTTPRLSAQRTSCQRAFGDYRVLGFRVYRVLSFRVYRVLSFRVYRALGFRV